MKKLVIISLALASTVAQAGWKIDLGIVTIGGGGEPVFGPGGIKMGPSAGPRGGPGGMVPTEPGSPGPRNSRAPLPPIPAIRSGTILDGKDAERLVGETHNFVFFGGPGRKRDKERLDAAERVAKAMRDGEEKTKNEKRNGLNRALEIATQNYNDWLDFQGQAPAVLASQDTIMAVAQKELASRYQLQANLRAAKNSIQDGNLALRLLSTVYSKQPVDIDPDKTINRALKAWIEGGKKIEEVAKNANMESRALVASAIASADESTLQQFIQQIGEMHIQVKGLLDTSAQKLQAALVRKEGLEKELSSLR